MELVFIHGPAAVGKRASRVRYRELRAADVFAFPALPEPLIALDTGTCSAQEAALEIATALRGVA